MKKMFLHCFPHIMITRNNRHPQSKKYFLLITSQCIKTKGLLLVSITAHETIAKGGGDKYRSRGDNKIATSMSEEVIRNHTIDYLPKIFIIYIM